MERNSVASLTLGIIGLVLDVVSIFICGWLGFIGLALGIVGLCLRGKFALRIPALVSIPFGAVCAILWIVALVALYA